MWRIRYHGHINLSVRILYGSVVSCNIYQLSESSLTTNIRALRVIIKPSFTQPAPVTLACPKISTALSCTGHLAQERAISQRGAVSELHCHNGSVMGKGSCFLPLETWDLTIISINRCTVWFQLVEILTQVWQYISCPLHTGRPFTHTQYLQTTAESPSNLHRDYGVGWDTLGRLAYMMRYSVEGRFFTTGHDGVRWYWGAFFRFLIGG